jgi:hypothetical protein
MCWVIQEVCGFYVAVQDLVLMDCGEGSKETLEIHTHIADFHVAKVVSEITVLEVWQDRDDLVLVTEGGDEGANRVAISKVVEEI